MASVSSQLRRGKPIQGQSREIVYNVYRYFIKEALKFKTVKDDDGSYYFNKVQERVVCATGVSRKTLSRILNEVDAETSKAVTPANPTFTFTTPKKGRPKKQGETDTLNRHWRLDQRFKTHLSNLASKRLRVEIHEHMIESNKRSEEGSESVLCNLDESDIAITESQDQYLDPITKRPVTDPVKNLVCGHIYEKDAIMNMISTKPTSTKCPVAGCGNQGPILMDHLMSDEELKFRITITKHSNKIQEMPVIDLEQIT